MSTAAASMIDTGKVPNRRSSAFRLDRRRLERSRSACRRRATRPANAAWQLDLGPSPGHIAGWTEFGYTGFPIKCAVVSFA